MHICNLWQHAERTLFWSLPTTGLCLFCLGNQIMSALPISTTLNLCFPILSPIFASETKRDNIYKSWIFCWVLDFQNLTFPNYLFAVTDLLPQPLEVKIFAQWGHIWKDIVEKNQKNATNVTLHSPVQTVLGHIWKSTVEKSRKNATNVTMPLIRQTI